MKTLPMLMAAALLLTTACSKSDADPQPAAPGPAGPESEIKATVGGVAFRAAGTNDVDGTRVATSSSGESPARLVLRGRLGSSDITLSIAQFSGAGTYAVLPAGPSVASYSEGGTGGPSYNSQHMAGAAAVGQVVVTGWDPAARRVQGTFSFSGRVRISSGNYGATKQVTGGEFDVRNILLF